MLPFSGWKMGRESLKHKKDSSNYLLNDDSPVSSVLLPRQKLKFDEAKGRMES